MEKSKTFASRAGEKLEFALAKFNLDVTDLVCADLGCSTGGFTHCLISRGAKKVYAVDTGYGVLDWQLRQNPRVICLERTNALFVELPEKMDFISIDVGWTPQHLILPHATDLLKPGGQLISLFKPHYESQTAKLTLAQSELILEHTLKELNFSNLLFHESIPSPLLGKKGGNAEFLLWFSKI